MSDGEFAGRVVLGMSGGVDSATSAMILTRASYEVVGLTALFIDSEASRAAAEDAACVCKQLGITHVVRDCIQRFECEVVAPFVDEYAAGRTPSPCVGCNARTKISALIETADELGCEKIATGHYARVARLEENGRFIVKTALDHEKDQSYMLSQLSQEQLSRLVLPLGAATKAEVRVMAEDAGLKVAHKQESQDICFISGRYQDFLHERGLIEEPGNIVDAAGVVRGQHTGLADYTIGQRKGIGVAAPEPYYVIGKRRSTNELVVGFVADTFISELVVHDVNWQAFECLEGALECMVKLRYRSQPAACVIEPLKADATDAGDVAGAAVRVHLRSPQAITAPGQFAVFYQGEDVLGGGVISATMSSDS